MEDKDIPVKTRSHIAPWDSGKYDKHQQNTLYPATPIHSQGNCVLVEFQDGVEQLVRADLLIPNVVPKFEELQIDQEVAGLWNGVEHGFYRGHIRSIGINHGWIVVLFNDGTKSKRLTVEELRVIPSLSQKRLGSANDKRQLGKKTNYAKARPKRQVSINRLY